MEPDLQRVAQNEDVFREVNEGIARGQWPGEGESAIGFRCECARLGCNQLIELNIGAYEDVRANARRFIVVPGHQVPETETVVGEAEGYLVVEKRGDAGRVAESLDPRD